MKSGWTVLLVLPVCKAKKNFTRETTMEFVCRRASLAVARRSQHALHMHAHVPSRTPACPPHCIHPHARARTHTAAPKHSIFILDFLNNGRVYLRYQMKKKT